DFLMPAGREQRITQTRSLALLQQRCRQPQRIIAVKKCADLGLVAGPPTVMFGRALTLVRNKRVIAFDIPPTACLPRCGAELIHARNLLRRRIGPIKKGLPYFSRLWSGQTLK